MEREVDVGKEEAEDMGRVRELQESVRGRRMSVWRGRL